MLVVKPGTIGTKHSVCHWASGVDGKLRGPWWWGEEGGGEAKLSLQRGWWVQRSVLAFRFQSNCPLPYPLPDSE